MSTMPDRNRRVAVIAASVAAGMLGLAYASAPLYTLFCQVTGFGGTPQRAAAAPALRGDTSISIRFDANVAGELGWTFRPALTTMTVKLGEVSLAQFVAHNQSSTPSTGTAVFNVTPTEAGIFFNKIECFCFTEQQLAPGQSSELPVQFFIDPAILEDADTRSIREITLSYTFYPANKKAADSQAVLSTH